MPAARLPIDPTVPEDSPIRITVVLPRKLRDDLCELADANGTAYASEVRQALRSHLARARRRAARTE